MLKGDDGHKIALRALQSQPYFYRLCRCGSCTCR